MPCWEGEPAASHASTTRRTDEGTTAMYYSLAAEVPEPAVAGLLEPPDRYARSATESPASGI